MKRTLIVFAGCAVAGFALAQGKPGDKVAPQVVAPKPAPAASAAKPGAAMPAAPAAHVAAADGKPSGAPGGLAAAGMPPMPKPAPELDAAFKFFEGSWKCDSKFPAGAMGPGSPETTTKSTVKFKKILSGFYYQGEYEIKKTKTMPGFKGLLLMGYQPAAKLFTFTSADDSGGAEYATSTGFQGDSITFTGEGYMMGQKVKLRESMSKNGKDAGHKFEADMGKGFQPMGEDTCKR